MLSASTSVEIDDGRADAQAFASHTMVGFGVVAGIGQEAVDFQIPARLKHRRLKKFHVVAGSNARQSRGDQMGLGVTDDRQLGEFSFAVSPVAVAEATGVMRRTKGCFQARGIDGRLGIGIDQSSITSICEDRAEQAFKTPFFARRLRAWNRVVGWGTFLSPKASRRSEKSAKSAMIPRSSVLKNCSRTRMASSWCWVKSLFENFDEYAGIALEATCRAFLANATGDRVDTRRSGVVSMNSIMRQNHKKGFQQSRFNRLCISSGENSNSKTRPEAGPAKRCLVYRYNF